MKIKRIKFTKAAKILLLALLLVPVFSTCKDEKPATEPDLLLSSGKSISNVRVVVANQTINAQLQSDRKTWNVTVPFALLEANPNALKTVTILFALSEKAVAFPDSGATIDFSEEEYLSVKVTAEDGSTADYVIHLIKGELKHTDYQIVWDEDSKAIKVSHNVASAEYGRMCFVTDMIWLATYTFGYSERAWENIAVRRSKDAGATWGEPFIIPRPANGWRVCFSEFIKLSCGRILLAYTYNNNPETNQLCTFNVLYSDDEGLTWNGMNGYNQGEAWKNPVIAARGRGWEPAMIQLEDGTVQMFYSSEARWWQVVSPLQQEILMVESTDRGMTWNVDEPKRVAYTLNARDGMPVPLVLKNNKGAVFVIEAVGASKSPSVIWTSNPKNWQTVGANATGPGAAYRWTVTNDGVWGGAPYITQFPNGITAVSLHGNGYRPDTGDWRKSDAMVYLGNEDAKNFVRNSGYPWQNFNRGDNNTGVIQNAIYALDSKRILIVSTLDRPSKMCEVWYKMGYIQLK